MQDVKHELLLNLLSKDDVVGVREIRDELLKLCLSILRDVKTVVNNGYYDDRQAMKEIVQVFSSHGIDCGKRNDSQQFFIHTE